MTLPAVNVPESEEISGKLPFFEKRLSRKKESNLQLQNELFAFLNESLKRKPLYKVKEEMNRLGWVKRFKAQREKMMHVPGGGVDENFAGRGSPSKATKLQVFGEGSPKMEQVGRLTHSTKFLPTFIKEQN